MDYKNISQRDKRAVLEQAVLTRSPEEVSILFKQLGQVENSARALGLACRFRGLEHVRALVEAGADFTYKRPEGEGGYYTIYYWLAPLEMSGTLRIAYFLDRRDECFKNAVTIGDRKCNALPVEQRVEIVKYLYENREKVCLDAGELLYYAIMSGSKRIIKVLKEFGVRFSEQRITAITEDGRSYEWGEFCNMLNTLGDGEYLEVVGSVAGELGGKTLHYTDSVYWGNFNPYQKQFRMFRPEFFLFILEHFDQKKMNKTKLMKGAINQNSVECLEICAEKGWLKMPRKRDEMIKYAAETGKTECSAWLLDFKNRTADFAAEREKAEKKMMRELNADPNSVTELKKIWSYEKREDGTIRITRYKGMRTEIDVPEKIGNSIVAEIGGWAFSARASRLKKEQIALRRSITRITLPETIHTIGKCAFYDCQALVQINIPHSVTMIGEEAFWGCHCLNAIELPEGITEICANTFASCQSLKSVTIPKTVAVIRKRAFQDCSALETAVILEGVVEIEQLAFLGCINLKTAVLPQSVKKIKNYTRKGQDPQTIFHKGVDVTVTVALKSYAEKYCKRNNIRYICEG